MNVILPTDREGVELRELTIANAAEYFDAVDNSRAHLREFEPGTEKKYRTLEDVEKSFEDQDPTKVRFGIYADDQFVGTVNLRDHGPEARVGYWVDARYTSRGFATLGAVAITEYAIDAGFKRVEAEVIPENTASLRVLEKAGYREFARIDAAVGLEVCAEGVEPTDWSMYDHQEMWDAILIDTVLEQIQELRSPNSTS